MKVLAAVCSALGLIVWGQAQAGESVPAPWLKRGTPFEQARAAVLKHGFKPLILRHVEDRNCYQWCRYPELETCSLGGTRFCNAVYIDRNFTIYILSLAGDPEIYYNDFYVADPEKASRYWAMAGL
jgi:hypothetical protein